MTRSVANGSGTPIHIKDANGNLQQLPDNGALGKRLYLAGLQAVADYPTKSDRYNGSIVNNSTTSTLIGSFTDTIHESEATESVTTINSTTTPLHQLDDALITLSDQAILSTDGLELYQMTEDELAAHAISAYSLNATHFYTNNHPGFGFYLSTNAPNTGRAADWEEWDADVFTDTAQVRNPSVPNYGAIGSSSWSIWRRKEFLGINFAGWTDTYGTSAVKKVIDSKFAVQQATDEEIGRSMMVGLQKLRANTGIGNYILAASGDTLPSGSWVAKGTALDYRRSTVADDFVGQRADGFDFTGHRGTAGADFENFANTDTLQKFGGTRDFAGPRDTTFSGQALATGNTDYTIIETYTLYVKTAV